MKENTKVSIFNKLTTKIIALIVLAVLVSSVLVYIFILPDSKKIILDMAEDDMISFADGYAAALNVLDAEGKADEAGDVLAGASVSGMAGSYAYLIDENGIMLYHPTASKIGEPVSNSTMKAVVADMQAGRYPSAGAHVETYVYEGTNKYCTYILLNNHNVLIIAADQKAVLSEYNEIKNRILTLALITILSLGVLGYLVTRVMFKSIGQLTEIISNTAKFDFRHSEYAEKICKKKDEIGVMGRAIAGMRSNLRSMVGDIEGASSQISNNVDELKHISGEINANCTDNSATTQQLAAGMEETAATSETINSNVGHVREEAATILDLSVEGEKRSGEVKKRAEEMKQATVEATGRTTKMYESVREKTAQAIEDSKAVEKINELTNAIMSISSQTSLLALNASIEAARAGEAGRGFAVVATEIGNLANQTSETVGNINVIVAEVNHAVASLADSLQETVDFLEKVVLKDYEQFAQVGEQYDQDANTFADSMGTIETSINQLADTISDIAEALNGINSTVNESTIGVTDIAEKTTSMVEQTVINNELVDNCMESVEQLRAISARFTMK